MPPDTPDWQVAAPLPDFKAGNTSDERLRQWAAATATADCDAACRLETTRTRWQSSWEDTDDAAERVCWGCDGHPWSREQHYVRRVWRAIHEEKIPIADVSEKCNLWSVPCPRGIEVRSRGSRCLVGHFAYAVLCFFRWIGEGNQAYGLVNLENAMDLARLVRNSACHDLFGFTGEEVALNYERILASVWHMHEGVPSGWLPALGASPAPGMCRGPTALEPQERKEEDLTGLTPPRVQCLVLVVWPTEEARMAGIADTYAASCKSLVFVTASDAPRHYRGYPIVDLRGYAGDMRPDYLAGAGDSREPHVFNTVQKTLRTFEWAAAHARATGHRHEVVCRLDSDTLFFPENLLRILHCRNFSSDRPWALGHDNYLHKHQEPGRLFLSGGNGICLSHVALDMYYDAVAQGEVKISENPSDWNTGMCVSAPGHWDDVVFGVCLALFGIPVSRRGTDCLGRSLFWPHTLEQALPGPEQIKPKHVPPKVSWFHAPEAGSEIMDDPDYRSYTHWRYRAWQHFACDPEVWIGDFPVSLHPYRNYADMVLAYKSVIERRPLVGYTPRLWEGDTAECWDLAC